MLAIHPPLPVLIPKLLNTWRAPAQTLRFEGDIHRTPPILIEKNTRRDGVLPRGSESCPRPGRQQACVKRGLPRAQNPT